MDKSQRQALEARFADELVKKRRGSFGKPINYVEGSAIIARLNDSLEGEWSFSIVEHFVVETGEVLVHGKLTALGIVKEAFGKSSPAISRETGEVLSVGDAYKAASTDALKKCATLLGVAAYLYSDELPDAVNDKPASAKHDKLSPSKPTTAARDRLSQKQLSTIWSMARNLNLDADAVRRRTMELYGVQPENLSKADASALITALEKRRAA
jgi:hypothetical protein